jgi:hypothetical protein
MTKMFETNVFFFEQYKCFLKFTTVFGYIFKFVVYLEYSPIWDALRSWKGDIIVHLKNERNKTTGNVKKPNSLSSNFISFIFQIFHERDAS